MTEPRLKFPPFVVRWGRVIWPVGAILFIVLLSYGSCTTYVRPGQYGIKQVILGNNQGVQSEIYPPGLHWLTPGAERMHTFPADLQVLEMSDLTGQHEPKTNMRQVPAIKIQTSEGYTVSVDITVLYRIEDAYKVMTQIGPGGCTKTPPSFLAPSSSCAASSASSTLSSSTRAAIAKRPPPRRSACSPMSSRPRAFTSPTCWCASTATTSATRPPSRAEDPGPDGLQEPRGGRRRHGRGREEHHRRRGPGRRGHRAVPRRGRGEEDRSRRPTSTAAPRKRKGG